MLILFKERIRRQPLKGAMAVQLTDRQYELLRTIIEEYIASAQPVGSKLVTQKYLSDVSPATVRNDMAVLEDQGYVHQPHVSSGRVPTAKAYELYVKGLPDDITPSEELYQVLQRDEYVKDERNRLKNIAKAAIEKTGESVFIGFSENDTFYTGISNLFAKPEFSNTRLVVDVSRLIDHLEGVVKQVMAGDLGRVEILIGNACKVSEYCSMIVAPLSLSWGEGILGLFGLMRMDYKKNRDVVKAAADIMNNRL